MEWRRLTRKEREKIVQDFFPNMEYITLYGYSSQRKIENLPKFIKEKINSIDHLIQD